MLKSLTILAVTMNTTFPTLNAPTAEKKTVSFVNHGIKRTDDYHWLRADNWQEVLRNPEVLQKDIRDYLEAENKYTDDMLAATKDLQKELFEELKGRIKEEDTSVPVKHKAYLYGRGYKAGEQYPYYFRTDLNGENQKVYLDVNKEGKDKKFFSLGGISVAPNHNYMIWSYDDNGSENYTLKFRDFTNLEDSKNSIDRTAGYAVWAADSSGFFYAKKDDNQRASHLYYHKLNSDSSEDKLIFHQKVPGYFMSSKGSKNHDFIYITVGNYEAAETWLVPASAPLTEPKLVRPLEDKVKYSLVSGGDVFYIYTNLDGADDFKVMVTPIDKPEPENWKDYIPYEKGRYIEGLDVTKDYFIWQEKRDGLSQIIVKDRKTGEEHKIEFKEEAYDLDLDGSSEYDSDVIRFNYSSMTTPLQVFDYNMKTRERKLLKQVEIPSGHNPDDYVTRRLYATAEDGTLIPLSVVYHKDTKLDGSAPALLYGYGSYGISQVAGFNSGIFSLLDRGFVYALAHTRGGRDKGTAWYENGKLDKKINTFTDFITAGRYLVEQKFTNHDALIAYGGSAGGLLMGAIANMAPQDYAAIVAAVPFVDTLNTILDDTLPLTPPEWTEWGNPITDLEAYKYIASYSPYDQVKKQNYPAMLVLAGLTDPRVTYWEPAKWVAKLREYKTDDNVLLLKTNMGAGHAGGSGRFTYLEEKALQYAFMLLIATRAQEKKAK